MTKKTELDSTKGVRRIGGAVDSELTFTGDAERVILPARLGRGPGSDALYKRCGFANTRAEFIAAVDRVREVKAQATAEMNAQRLTPLSRAERIQSAVINEGAKTVVAETTRCYSKVLEEAVVAALGLEAPGRPLLRQEALRLLANGPTLVAGYDSGLSKLGDLVLAASVTEGKSIAQKATQGGDLMLLALVDQANSTVLRDAYVSRLGLTLDELPRWRTRVRLASLDQGALGDVEHVLDRLRLNTRNTIAALLSISDGAGREEIVAATSSVLEAIDGVVALLALRRVDDLRRVTA